MWVYPPNCRTKVGTRWSPSFPRQSLARRRARNIVQVHAHALNGSWECSHVVRIGLGAIWGDHGRRRSLHFTTPHSCLKKGWVYPICLFPFLFLFFSFLVRKIPFAGIELTSQRVRGLRGTSELPMKKLFTSNVSHSMYVLNVCMLITHSKGKDQPGKVANPARGQVNTGKRIFPCPRSHLIFLSSRETGSAVPSRVSLLIFILRVNIVLTYYGIPPEFRGGRGVYLFT